MAYDRANREIRGSSARCNFPPPEEIPWVFDGNQIDVDGLRRMKLAECQNNPEVPIPSENDENQKKRGRRKGMRKKASEYDTKCKKMKDDLDSSQTLQRVRFTSPAIDIPQNLSFTSALRPGHIMGSTKTPSSMGKSCNEVIHQCTALMTESHPVSFSSDDAHFTSHVFTPIPSPRNMDIEFQDFFEFGNDVSMTTVEGKPTYELEAVSMSGNASPVLGHPVDFSESFIPYNLQMELDFYNSFRSVMRQCYVEREHGGPFVLEYMEDDLSDSSEFESSFADDEASSEDEEDYDEGCVFDIGPLKEALKNVIPSDVYSLQRTWMQGYERMDTELTMSI